MRRVLLIAAIFLLPLIPIVLVVTGVLQSKPQTVPAVTLTIWGTEEATAKPFEGLVNRYKQLHPYVTVNYLPMRVEDYFDRLRNGWASGQGPDLFLVPNSWVGQMRDFATPMPRTLAVPIVETKRGLLGTSAKVSTPQKVSPSLNTIQQQFVDAVVGDVIQDSQLWGLPLAMDTIVTYYNKDLLNNSRIFEPAKTWAELKSQVAGSKLTVLDAKNNVVQSGVAMGTADNVPYTTDLLTLLMMQNGATMTTPEKRVLFQEVPGLTALNFYISFAQLQKETYSWNADQGNALDAFLQGKVAYYFGTLADRAKIAASSLKWDVAPMLHMAAEGDIDAQSNAARFIDVAKYQVMMISKASGLVGRSVQAWNFLEYISHANNVGLYVNETGKLYAQRKLLTQQKDDPARGLYAGQLLTARSWYHGRQGPAMENYLKTLIRSVTIDRNDSQEALNLAAKQVESTL